MATVFPTHVIQDVLSWKSKGLKPGPAAYKNVLSASILWPSPTHPPALGTATLKSHQAQDDQVYNSDSKQWSF